MIAYKLMSLNLDGFRFCKKKVPSSAYPAVFYVGQGRLEVWPPLPEGWRLEWLDDNGTQLAAVDER